MGKDLVRIEDALERLNTSDVLIMTLKEKVQSYREMLEWVLEESTEVEAVLEVCDTLARK